MERAAIIIVMILLDAVTDYLEVGIAFGVLMIIFGGAWVNIRVRAGKQETKIKHNNQEINMMRTEIAEDKKELISVIKKETDKNSEGRARLYDRIGDVEDKITPLAVGIGEIKGMLQEHLKKNGKP